MSCKTNSARRAPPPRRDDLPAARSAGSGAYLYPKYKYACALLVFLLFGLSALQSFGPRAFAAPPQMRVVSQTVGNDELLLAVASPSQIAALSHLATESDFSAVAAQAAAFPKLDKNATAESILSFSPTLVLFTDYSRTELVEQIHRAGVRSVIIKNYRTLDDTYGNLRLIAAELGPEAAGRAERLIAGCEARVAALRAKMAGAKPVRVIAPSTYGVIPGRDTTFQDLCDHAAAENLAATLGGLRGHAPPPSEKMIAWPVDKVVLISGALQSGVRPLDGEDPVQAALAPFLKLPPYQFMPAVRERRVALLEPWQISCVSHHRVAAYERLARELHPERFAHAE
ncbi:ABC transporter substrate-binding protein [Termitidicoccus mucosus]|uniref:Fe/B12 periplasmic-binding domain-containing protein n=1 Tax=Termitidicoccus mucosus TaxID=1184151 RepID=A0A178IP26_9BACT|nr:hypothetical protein AW736_04795 [Opitutaceae bacterium TSB47]